MDKECHDDFKNHILGAVGNFEIDNAENHTHRHGLLILGRIGPNNISHVTLFEWVVCPEKGDICSSIYRKLRALLLGTFHHVGTHVPETNKGGTCLFETHHTKVERPVCKGGEVNTREVTESANKARKICTSSEPH